VPFFQSYCVDCHGQDEPEAGVNLTSLKRPHDVTDRRKKWQKVLEMLQVGAMPPSDADQPDARKRHAVAQWLEQTLFHVDCSKQHDPGRVTIRRLNRAEYNNTIRDLFGIDLKPANAFPSDDVGEGFDNIGDVLSLSPLLMEKYVLAAEQVAAAVKVPSCSEDTQSERDCVRGFLRPLAGRIFRRPVTDDETTRLTKLVEATVRHGETVEQGLRVAVQAMLVSPHFLFRIERDAHPRDAAQRHRVSDHELASRLSYFVWSSMPDDELFELARANKLHRRPVLESQTRRMLRDPKAQALVENFAGQWLNLRNLDEIVPDPKRFPEFNDALRKDMVRETQLFFAAVMREDRSILDFLDGRFSYLNERLARHYGIPNVRGGEFRKVALKNRRRAGVLTQASVLTLTSYPTRTSPVRRGKWILENILGDPPPPPPPNVPQLEETAKAAPNASLREQMTLHRKDPVCASCHVVMDELGFSFEQFDAIGRWRDSAKGEVIDASGTLPSGETFQGPEELRRILKRRRQKFARCLTEKMLTYALGRGLQYYDRCAVDQIVIALDRADYRFLTLVLGIVTSDPFFDAARRRT